MKRTITVVNTTTQAIKLDTVPQIVLLQGTHDYSVKFAVADAVVRLTTNMEGVSVQLPQDEKPSTVDGGKEVAEMQGTITKLNKDLEASKQEVETVKAELKAAQDDNKVLVTANAELERKLVELEAAKDSATESTTEEQKKPAPKAKAKTAQKTTQQDKE